MRSNLKTCFCILLLSICVLSFGPKVYAVSPPNQPETPTTNANNYTLLAPLPLPQDTGNIGPGDVANTTTPSQYIKGIINLAVAAAGVIAVLKLVLAGFKYIASDIPGVKGSAKGDIQNAIIGLVLAIGAFTILQTIGTQFTTLTIFKEIADQANNVSSDKPLVSPDTCIGDIVDGTCVNNGQVVDTGTATAESVGCITDCVPMATGIPHKLPENGGCKLPGPCFINKNLETDLQKVATDMAGKVDWQVTEMFPPKDDDHTSSCHQSGVNAGKCVDASLSNPTTNNIKTFLTTVITDVGPSYQYEVTSQARLDELQKAFNHTFVIVLNTKATGEHVHINGPGIAGVTD